MTKAIKFLLWLQETKPDVKLLPWQERVVRLYFGTDIFAETVFKFPKAYGKTFLMDLIREYEDSLVTA